MFPGRAEQRRDSIDRWANQALAIVDLRLYSTSVASFNMRPTDLITNLQPHFVKMMDLDEPITTSHGIGFERTFVHWDGVASHLSFSWGNREIGNVDSWLPDSCVEAVSDGHPVMRNPSLRPQFDEETGRIVHASRDTVQVVDAALIYMPRVVPRTVVPHAALSQPNLRTG